MTVISQSLKSELECHKNNSLLAQRKKKKKKESKGEIQISHREVPPPACRTAELKRRGSAGLFQSPFISGPGPSAYCLSDKLCLVSISSLSPFATSVSALNPDCEDGRGPTPRRECGEHTKAKVWKEQAIAGGLHNSGTGAAPVPHLRLPALPCFSGKMLHWALAL